MPARIGIFGGTFDPPHLGHLVLASEAFSQLHLTRLLWVLTPTPPHKLEQPISELHHRLAMVQLELEQEPAFELSNVDLDRPGPHYSLDTLKILAAQQPAAELILLIGGDSLHDLPAWHRPLELIDACHQLGVMRRPGDDLDLPQLEKVLPGLKEKLCFFDAPLLEIASSEIRRRASLGLPCRYFLLPAVYEYIQRNRLYR